MSYSYILYLLFWIKFTDLDHIHLSASINFCLANVIFILQNALNIFKQRKSNLYSLHTSFSPLLFWMQNKFTWINVNLYVFFLLHYRTKQLKVIFPSKKVGSQSLFWILDYPPKNRKWDFLKCTLNYAHLNFEQTFVIKRKQSAPT